MSSEEYEALCQLLIEIEESGAELPDKDRRFLESQRQRVDTFGPKVNISAAQLAWLQDIHGRALR